MNVNYTIQFSVKWKNDIELKVSKEWLDGDVTAFVKASQDDKDSRIDWGVGIKW